MKSILYILTLMVLSGICQANQKPDRSEYHTTQDTVFIATYFGDTLKYSKEYFNRIVDNNPIFLTKYTQDPDQTYHCYAGDMQFLSEAGQDRYYVLYAYFLQQRNGIDEYAQRRGTLIDIFSNIGSLT